MRPSPAVLLATTLLLLGACRDPTAADHLELTVSVDRNAFTPPEEVVIRVRAINRSSHTVRFSGSGSGTLWTEVRSLDGTPAVQHRGHTDDLRTWILSAGDSVVVVRTWDGRGSGIGAWSAVPAGEYQVVGRLTAEQAELTSAPVVLTVMAPTP